MNATCAPQKLALRIISFSGFRRFLSLVLFVTIDSKLNFHKYDIANVKMLNVKLIV